MKAIRFAVMMLGSLSSFLFASLRLCLTFVFFLFPGIRRIAEVLRGTLPRLPRAAKQKGGLDLTALPFQPADPDNFARWVKVHDRIAAGEMPPKKKPRPSAADVGAVTKSGARRSGGRRAQGRR
jgi:hypothetical protein